MMKKRVWLALIILVGVLVTVSCKDRDGGVSEPESTDGEQTAQGTQSDVPSVTAEPTPIIYYAETAEELKALAANDECEEICISGEITVTEKIVIKRPVNITVKAPLLSDGGCVVVVCDGEAEIAVKADGAVIYDGAVLVDAPDGSLVWSGISVPHEDFVRDNMNVKNYNGKAVEKTSVGGPVMPEITDVVLKSTQNTTFKTDVNLITVEIPYGVKESSLASAELGINAGDAAIKAITKESGEAVSGFNLRESYLVTLELGEKTRTYRLKLKRQAKRLPVVSLYTDGGAVIASKETYVGGSMSIDCSGASEFAGCDFEERRLGVKGRGNASWNYTDKKSYRIKFEEKTAVLGLSADKDWVLVPNYFDKSLVRNALAHEMADELDYLYYNPTHIMVDLFVNGEYRGVYSIADKIEESSEKIDLGATEGVSDIGFLIEIGWDYGKENVYGKDFFDTPTIVRLFVKEPEITEWNNAQMQYIMSYINKVDAAVVSGEGYEQYFDMDALVDWFILAELTNNTEMAFYRSCYFYKPEGGKIVMGPVWDFDMAFGNHRGDIYGYDGWATAEATYDYVNDTWATYLIKDEAFMERVKARWLEVRDVLLGKANRTLDELYYKVNPSQVENFKLWDIMDKQVGEGNVDYTVYNTYELQIQYIREFLTKRAAWIDAELGLA